MAEKPSLGMFYFKGTDQESGGVLTSQPLKRPVKSLHSALRMSPGRQAVRWMGSHFWSGGKEDFLWRWCHRGILQTQETRKQERLGFKQRKKKDERRKKRIGCRLVEDRCNYGPHTLSLMERQTWHSLEENSTEFYCSELIAWNTRRGGVYIGHPRS